METRCSELGRRSLVCILGKPIDKRQIEHDPIRQLIQDDDPRVIEMPMPDAPLIFDFPNTKLQVIFLNNRITIQFDGRLDIVAREEFSSICAKVLAAIGEQEFRAFGFNVFCRAISTPPVHKLIGVDEDILAPEGFTFTPLSIVKLRFTQEDGINYTVDLTDEAEGIGVHVNIHHELAEGLQAAQLSSSIEDIYARDADSANTLIEEVLRRGLDSSR